MNVCLRNLILIGTYLFLFSCWEQKGSQEKRYNNSTKKSTWQMSPNKFLHSLTKGKMTLWSHSLIWSLNLWHPPVQVLTSDDRTQVRGMLLMLETSGRALPGSAQTGTGQLWLTPVQLWWCQLWVMSSHHQNCHNDKHTLRPENELLFFKYITHVRYSVHLHCPFGCISFCFLTQAVV